MALFYADGVYISSTAPDRIADWYREKLGCPKPRKGHDDVQEVLILSLGSSDPNSGIWIGREPRPPDIPAPLIYANDIERAHKTLTERGVNVTAIETDRQGSRYFELRDPEGNVVEISEEP